jgi:methionyl-tRNA synthetase
MAGFYVTTPIYYVNDAPHLGSAYTTIACDALARFHRARGEDTWFLTGTDEHGEKIEEAAKGAGRSALEHADIYVERFRDAWRGLDISNDDFIRTTEPRHKAFVVELWKKLVDAGDIYKGQYEDWYCVACEAFYPDAQQLREGERRLCPTHRRELQLVKEESYFFRMSKYQDRLLAYIKDHPGFIQPEYRKNEVVAFVESGLRDISVSRTSFKWGIPVPGDPEHVIYVWIDALTNYISALGGPGSELYGRFWPGIHLIGKDILRFHAVYWPTMLMSAGLPLPRAVFAHGWWTVNGEKMSKSLGNVVDPLKLAADLGPDAVRYFVLRETAFGADGDFSFDAFLGRFNSDLANDLGNLVHRTVAMTQQFLGGQVPSFVPGAFEGEALHMRLAEAAVRAREEVARHLEELSPTRALEALFELVRAGNKYIDEAAPFRLAKDPARRAEVEHVMRGLLETCAWCALLAGPFMPRKAAEILDRLGVEGGPERIVRWPQHWGRVLKSGGKVAPGEPLWPRLDDDRKAALKAAWGVKPAGPKAEKTEKPAKPAPDKPDKPAEAPGTIQIEDFQKLDLRVAVVRAAEKVPKADKLLKLTLDVGGQTRTVLAGIAEAYTPEAVIGRSVIFLANLAPRTMRGVTSEGMILAAGDGKTLALSALEHELPPGTKVR